MVMGRRSLLGLAIGAMGTIVGPRLTTGFAARAEGAPDAGPEGVGTAYVEANGIRLHYRIAGSGPSVILLHGWPQTSFAWTDAILGLKDRYTVIAPDLRGTGRSERPTDGYDKRPSLRTSRR